MIPPLVPNTESKRRGAARTAARRALQTMGFAIFASGVLLSPSAVRAADTEYDVTNGQTDLTLAATFTTGGTSGTGVGGTTAAAAPSVTSDVTFDSGVAYAPAAFTVNTSVNFGSINDLSTTAITVSNTGATASTLTLGGSGFAGDSVTGANAADLLFVGTGANLTLAPGAGVMGVALGQSGNFDVVGTATVSAVISGGFGLTKTGAGTLTISGVNTFSGGLNLNTGILTVGNNANAGASTNTITFAGGTLTSGFAANNGTAFALGSATAANNGIITVAAGQTGTINMSARTQIDDAVTGAGTLNIVANTTISRDDFQNTFAGFTGNLNLSGTGTIRLGLVALATGQPTFNAAGWASTTLSVDGVNVAPTTNSTGNTILIGALSSTGAAGILAGGTAGTPTYQIGALNTSTTYGGIFNGNAAVTKVGTGTLTLTGASAYTGVTTINAGTLNINGINALGGAVYGGNAANNGVTFNGGMLQYSATLTSNGDITVAAGGTTAKNVTISAGGATIGTGANNITYTNSIGNNGTGALTKAGTGVLTLAAASTYTGGTTINGGTLTIGANGGLSSGNVTVTAGTTLELGTGVTAAHSVSTTTLTLLGTTSIVMLDGAMGTVQDSVTTLIVNGVTEPVGTYGSSTSGAANILSQFTGTGVLVVVPEPSTWAMLLGGTAGLTALALRRRRAI